MNKPELGDVIFSDHKLYNHYGIYAGSNKVIHYNKDDKNNLNGLIKETDFNTFLDGGNLHICKFSEKVIRELWKAFPFMNSTNTPLLYAMRTPGPWQYKLAAYMGRKAATCFANYFSNNLEINRSAVTIYDAKETVNRARSKIGTGNYNLFFHNCEHFAIWCKTGLYESVQVKKALQIILPF